MDDRELIERFEACTLPNEAFHHADHVRLAWLYLRDRPALDALGHLSSGLQRFAAANGKPDRYHETITWAFLFLIRERMAGLSAGHDWREFASAHPDLLNGKDNILQRYYRRETLMSDLARRTFLLPDRLA